MKNFDINSSNKTSAHKSSGHKGEYAPLRYFEYYDDETKTFRRLDSTLRDEHGTPIITYEQFEEFMLGILTQQERKKRKKRSKRSQNVR